CRRRLDDFNIFVRLQSPNRRAFRRRITAQRGSLFDGCVSSKGGTCGQENEKDGQRSFGQPHCASPERTKRFAHTLSQCVQLAGVGGTAVSTPTRACGTVGVVCCARAASGHATAPPSSVMKSRRVIRSRLRDRAQNTSTSRPL